MLDIIKWVGIWWIWALFILHWMRVKRKLDMQRAISSVRSRPLVILGLMQLFGIIIMGGSFSEGYIFSFNTNYFIVRGRLSVPLQTPP